MEGSNYQYEFECTSGKSFQFSEDDRTKDIVSRSNLPNCKNQGNIRTNIYVGTLTLPVCEIATENVVGEIRFEIRSVKANYESDYRAMLDEIAEYYTDLVLQQGAPVTQHLEVNADCDSLTLYQKFSFVRGIIDSESFQEAIHKIITSPVRKWTDTTVERNICAVRRLSRRNIRQIITANDRIPSPALSRITLTSIPQKLEVDYKRDTVDNQENQFVKFTLRTFLMFCSELKEKKNASDRLKVEVSKTIDQITSYLDMQFFRQVSMPSHLNMNSPVLQRKEGYREILQAWLMYELAAKLNWTGGNNVYEAGKKNVSTLYEYWLFFKLLELISTFFQIAPADKQNLVNIDDDKIDLNIIQGRKMILHGKSLSTTRVLNIAFYYNRTFSKTHGEESIHQAGSWTMSMRPDYTLSIWPGEIDELTAEKEELITHIHFDAKYRLNKVVLEDQTDILQAELDEEKAQQELGIYKRADLLKMHAYKDAIRRTSGAYVLYPGTETREIRGFHEIIPGLGAFCIRPGHWNEDSLHLKTFLSEVKAHMLNRTSEREKMSYYQYDIYREKNPTMLMERMPEPNGANRSFLPDETSVIVAYYKDTRHIDWILNKHLYNMRAGDDRGSMNLSKDLISAKYLILHNGTESTHFIKLMSGGPKVYTRSQLINNDYPPYLRATGEIDLNKEYEEANRIYLIFSLDHNNGVDREFENYYWTISDILMGRPAHKPFSEKLSNLMKKVKQK